MIRIPWSAKFVLAMWPLLVLLVPGSLFFADSRERAGRRGYWIWM